MFQTESVIVDGIDVAANDITTLARTGYRADVERLERNSDDMTLLHGDAQWPKITAAGYRADMKLLEQNFHDMTSLQSDVTGTMQRQAITLTWNSY